MYRVLKGRDLKYGRLHAPLEPPSRKNYGLADALEVRARSGCRSFGAQGFSGLRFRIWGLGVWCIPCIARAILVRFKEDCISEYVGSGPFLGSHVVPTMGT